MNFLRELLGIKKEAQEKPYPGDFKTPMSINEAMEDKYGKDWLEYYPETIRPSLIIDFKINIDEILINKIMATQTALTNADLENDWDMFENVILSFNDKIPDFEVMQGLSMSELVWGYLCIKALNPDFEMSDEVKGYVKAMMIKNGLIWNPWLGLSVGSTEVTDKIKEVWKSLLKIIPNDIIGVQIDRLSIIREYVKTWQ